MEDKVHYLRKNKPMEGMDLIQIIDYLGLKRNVIAMQLGISEPTLRDRLVNVKSFTIKDIIILADFIHVPREELIKVILREIDSINIID